MQYDIIIIGGGMVGASLAVALRSFPYKVALVDATPFPAPTDHRLIALNYSSYCLLKNLNIWSQLQDHATSINQIHISHRKHFGMTRLTAKNANLPTLGYVIPAHHINTALYTQLNHVTLLRPATLTHIVPENSTLTIATESGTETITGKIIIGADGTHSTLREQLAIPTKKIAYQQRALVTTVELEHHHSHQAYERFLANGAIAILPLPQNTVAVIWTDQQDKIEGLLKANDAIFLQELQKNFGYRLGFFKNVTARYSYPLQFIMVEQQVKENIVLIGNAAHTFHPIAAQGLNLALYEIAALIDYFTSYQLSLDQFKIQQHHFSAGLSHRLSWIFAHDFFPLKTLRQMAMLGLDLSSNLKKYFVNRAIGRRGTIPSLLMEREVYERSTN